MTAALAALTSLGPLATDMYLPSLPALAAALRSSTADAQLTLSTFLVGFAVGQIVYGPYSDRHGRRPLLVIGFAVFIVGSIACALATSIEMLMVARFVQAIGASGPIVLARAIVRDLYSGARAGQELSRMGSFMGLMPAIAPVVGGLLHVGFGWRSSFVAMAAMGIGLGWFTYVAMPETIVTRRREPISLPAIVGGFGVLLGSPVFRTYTAISSLAYGGLFAYISASSFVLQGIDGMSAISYGLAFFLTASAYIGGTVSAQKLGPRLGLDGTIMIGVLLLVAGALLQLVGVLVAPHYWGFLVGAQMIYLAGVGLAMPQALAAAMTPFPARAGAASSLFGLVQMSFGALVGALVGHALGQSALPLPITGTLLACAALALFLITRPSRHGNPAG